jgi:hypothetical protein
MRPLRKASWAEVALLFSIPGDEMMAVGNCRIWADRFGLPHEDYEQLPVQLEAWEHEEIGAELSAMALIEPRMFTPDPPRCFGLPLAVVRFSKGRHGMIDGRHRANMLMHRPGSYAVLVIQANE